MKSKDLVRKWFACWEKGEFQDIPVLENFKHTSPFGTIEGKKAYLSLVAANKDKFLGYKFEVHDEIFLENKACVRYSAIQGSFSLDVSEWYYIGDGSIAEILAYYHIGEIREERILTKPQ